MNKEVWKDNQNETLKMLATQIWQNKKELLSEIAAKMPKISATAALYHALKHENLKFTIINGRLCKEAQIEAKKKLIEDGLDSYTVSQHIHRVYKVFKTSKFFNRLRFTSKRGEYAVLKDSNNKFYLEHRAVAAKAMGQKAIKNKLVTHPNTIKVNNNLLGELFVTEPRILYKIQRINFVGEVLGLPFGTLQEFINEELLQTKTADTILQEMFKASGLNLTAKKLFIPKQTNVGQA